MDPAECRALLPRAIQALCRAQLFAEAYAVAEAAAIAFPNDADIPMQGAMAAILAGDLRRADACYADCRARFPDAADAWGYGALALRVLGRVKEAQELAETGTARFPDSATCAIEAAECASAQGAAKALALWRGVHARFKDRAESHWRYAHELLRAGDVATAEQVVAEGIRAFPDHNFVLWQHAEVATRRRQWEEAERRWQAALQLHPGMRELENGYGEMKLAASLARLEQAAPAAALAEADPPRARLAAQFEALGDNCEFGIVQRLCGIEPLGLLRWANINPARLQALVADGCAGVGDAAFTRLDLLGTGEYDLRDIRYFGMHTFIKAGQEEPGPLLGKMQRRLRFLAARLMEDLRTAEKVFIYKSIDTDITLPEAKAIKSAMARHGDAQLLCVRRPWDGAAHRQVETLAPGLHFGFLDGLTPDPHAARHYLADWLHVLERCSVAAGLPVTSAG